LGKLAGKKSRLRALERAWATKLAVGDDVNGSNKAAGNSILIGRFKDFVVPLERQAGGFVGASTLINASC